MNAAKCDFSSLGMPAPIYGFADYKRMDYGKLHRKKHHANQVHQSTSHHQISGDGTVRVVAAQAPNNVFLSPTRDNLGGLGTASDLGHVAVPHKDHVEVSRQEIADSQRELLRVHEEIMELENELRKIRPP